MSIEAIAWVINYSESERSARLVLISIANNANNEGRESYPSIETLCRNSRLSESSVHAAIKELVKIGELHVEPQASRWRTNLYSIPKMHPVTIRIQGAKNQEEGAKEGAKMGSEIAPNPSLTLKPSYNKEQELIPLVGFVLPDWIPVESWNGFDEMRHKMGAKQWTERAKVLTVKTLERLRALGQDPGDCLDQSVERGWRGVFEVKKNGGNSNGNGLNKDQQRSALAAQYAKEFVGRHS